MVHYLENNYAAQWSNAIRNVADINNTHATDIIPVVSVPIDSVSSEYLTVKKNHVVDASWWINLHA